MRKASLIIAWWILLSILIPAADTDAARLLLRAVDRATDPEISDWHYQGGAGTAWQGYTPGRTLEIPVMTFRADVRIPEIFAGAPVAGSPLFLDLTLYSNGLSTVTVTLDGHRIDRFDIDAANGTGREISRRIAVSKAARPGTAEMVITVENQGFKPLRDHFWPPRRSPLPEEGIGFALRRVALDFPAASDIHQRIRDWVVSMQTADALLNPDLIRHTFIGQPWPIKDHRRVAPERLADLEASWAQAVMAFDQTALTEGRSADVNLSLDRSVALAAPLAAYAREFKVYLIGNAHIDIAWLWRMRETVEVAHNTYDTVIKNMGEYPELRYAQSQAVTYDWMEKKYPDLFKRIGEKIRSGQWEVVGGMWVEPDCNLISGESWVRQILYGKRYFKDKFGVDVHIGWNPDSFGYNWNMPQLFRKSGIDRFITQKIRWNDTTVFPYYYFWWQGVDGTRLLTYFPPLGYTSSVMLPRVVDALGKYEATTGSKKTLILWGLGDHGGGPNREILDRVRGYDHLLIRPDFIHARADEFFKAAPPESMESLPVWKDELYLEYHRGTYTTQAETKKNNRRTESALGATEKMAAVASLMGVPYPHDRLEAVWKTALTNQFHDILPGSSITPVYRDAAASYRQAGAELGRLATTALDGLAAAIDTRAREGVPVLVFNPLSWDRTDWIRVDVPAEAGKVMHLVDTEGRTVPLELIADPDTGQVTAGFVAESVPSLGYRVYWLQTGAAEPPTGELTAAGTTLENRFLRVTVNPRTGNISSLYDKRLKREFVPAGREGNRLEVYEDRPENWDAWNIGYTGRHWVLDRADEVSLVTATPVRATIRVRKSFLGLAKERYSPTQDFPSSFFTQTITLYRGMDRVDVRNQMDWWESHMMLKMAFPTGIRSDEATYEIPFAAIRRTTRRETLAEKARFEVPALRWADLSDGTVGLSVVNNAKYGYDIAGDTMRLSLLRSPTWPDPMADRGRHEFVYSFYPHGGEWNDGATVRRGLELNTPLRAAVVARHPGRLAPMRSFFRVEGGGVVLDTVKAAEDGGGLVLRLYDASGRGGAVTLTLPEAPLSVTETNLMEQPLKEMKAENKSVALDFDRFEIKTIRIRWP